jgi:hypothetical protein
MIIQNVKLNIFTHFEFLSVIFHFDICIFHYSVF